MNLPKVKAVLFKSKVYKDGTHPILIRVTQDRKMTYKSTGHSVMPEAWDDEAGFVYEKKPQISKRQEGQLLMDWTVSGKSDIRLSMGDCHQGIYQLHLFDLSRKVDL